MIPRKPCDRGEQVSRHKQNKNGGLQKLTANQGDPEYNKGPGRGGGKN